MVMPSRSIEEMDKNQHIDAAWEDTLLSYLRVSNEDDAIVGLFEELSPLIRKHLDFNELRWLDVGPGPGSKTQRILGLLREAKHFDTVRMDLLEPSPIWRAHLQANGVASLAEHLYPDTFQSFGTSRLRNYGLLTFIHVLHDRGNTADLVRGLDALRTQGARHVSVVVVEAEDSDLFLIRKRLAKVGLVPNWEAPASVLPDALHERGLIFRLERVESQECCLTGSQAEDRWLYPFLLATSMDAYQQISQALRGRVESIVDDYLEARPAGGLRVPDEAFLIFLP